MNSTDIFASRVHAVVTGIPAGRVMTYGGVASAAGFPGAARAVGTLMRKNHDASIPCHRVVRSDGAVGQYNREGGSRTKAERLRGEGVLFLKNDSLYVDLGRSSQYASIHG